MSPMAMQYLQKMIYGHVDYATVINAKRNNYHYVKVAVYSSSVINQHIIYFAQKYDSIWGDVLITIPYGAVEYQAIHDLSKEHDIRRGAISINKLLQHRHLFKKDTHPNKPRDVKMTQGLTRRIQASQNGNVQFTPPSSIKVNTIIEVREGDKTIKKEGDSNSVIVKDTQGHSVTVSFDLLETFYHAAKKE